MAMLYSTTCPDGPSFSRIIAGAWRWHPGTNVDALTQTALDLGITTFDHADIYGDYQNEIHFGTLLRKKSSLRQQMQLISKCGIKLISSRKPEHQIKHYDTSKAHILASVEQSLDNLCTDYLDLLLLHRPDPLMDPDEIAEAFLQLRDQGKVRYFGVSNFTPAQFELLAGTLPMPLVTNQIEISAFQPAPLLNGSVEYLHARRVSPMAWSPLGGGKFLNGENEVGRRVLDGLNKWTIERGATTTHYLLAWLLRHPANLFPVIGTSRTERIAEAASAVNHEMSRQDWFQILQWSLGKEVA
ncbi:MAG: aldo/keto reductase [Cyclobacteriaceae bacterium]|nr:aldo/keto reductase [Cyclobacteriaceae bacterium]